MFSDDSENMLKTQYAIVYNWTLSLCHDETLAQDITQETFFKAMKSYDSFSHKCSESTWLCTIAKNLYINHCKKQGRQTELCENLPDNSSSIESKIADEDTAMRIHTVLHTMKEPYKEVFSLRIFGQLSFEKIAGLFGKTESWARVTYYRAKKIIIETLEKDDLL